MKYKHLRTTNSSFLAKRLARKSRRRFLVTIVIAVILIYSLFTWLLPNFIGGLLVLNRFKTNPNAQTPTSENSTLAPPILNIPYEATNSASISIKGYAQPHTKVEIYLDDELKNTTETKDDGSFITDPIDLAIGTNNISGKTIDDNNHRSLPSKTIKIFYDREKPKLELSQPQDNQEIKGGDKKVTVSGSTDNSKNITITINSIQTIVGTDGNFSRTIDINEGDNNITVIAVDEAGNTAQLARKVVYTPQ